MKRCGLDENNEIILLKRMFPNSLCPDIERVAIEGSDLRISTLPG